MTDVIVHAHEPQTVSVPEAASILGVGATTLYELARTTGEVVPGLPFLIIGSRRRIPRARLLAYAAGEWQPAKARKP